MRVLDIETLAIEGGDPAVLAIVDHGARLQEMTARLVDTAGQTTTIDYRFDWMHLTVARAGGQAGNRLALEGAGTMEETVHAADGMMTTGNPRAFDLVFALRPGSDNRWFIVDVSPVDGT